MNITSVDSYTNDLRSLSSIVTVVMFLMYTPVSVASIVGINPGTPGSYARITLSLSSRVTSSFRVIREIVARLFRSLVEGIVS